jgi:hypothetical protein
MPRDEIGQRRVLDGDALGLAGRTGGVDDVGEMVRAGWYERPPRRRSSGLAVAIGTVQHARAPESVRMNSWRGMG